MAATTGFGGRPEGVDPNADIEDGCCCCDCDCPKALFGPAAPNAEGAEGWPKTDVVGAGAGAPNTDVVAGAGAPKTEVVAGAGAPNTDDVDAAGGFVAPPNALVLAPPTEPPDPNTDAAGVGCPNALVVEAPGAGAAAAAALPNAD